MSPTNTRSSKEMPLVLLAIPMLPDFYGSKPVKNASDDTIRQRKLGDDEDLFAKTATLLEQLEKEGSAEYPQLVAARTLLYRKQVECDLMLAWSRWHDDRGDPGAAAAAFEMFLSDQDISKVYHLDDPADPLLVYTSHLLTALLEDENPYSFGSQKPLPVWIDRTLLIVIFQEYANLRQAMLDFRLENLQTAASDAAELAEKFTVPWLRLLAYELQADVLTAARQKPKFKAVAAMGDLGDLINILNKWRRLWPEENPIAGARFYEAQGQLKRAERIRWHLGEMALEQHIQGNDKGARRILETFTEAELPLTRMPGSHQASIQQLWMFLSAGGEKQARLVLELEHADEEEIENWIETEDPYAMWGACPKAVLPLTQKSEPHELIVGYGADDLLRYLQTELDRVGIYSAKVERFQRVYRRGQSEEQSSDWIWLKVINAGSLGALAFAIEVETNLEDKTSWMIHTLIELDPVDPRAVSWRKPLRLIINNSKDLAALWLHVYDDCSSALAKLV
jgi:hypothetical protein